MSDDLSDASERLRELLDLHNDAPATGPQERAVGDFLLFELGGITYAIKAHQVEEVIAWRPPLPLPRADARVMGIIQDRGRIIVILSNPAGSEDATPLRIIVCRTHRGYLGLPAGKTRCVDSLKMHGDLVPKSVVSTSEGIVTFLDAAQLVASSQAPSRPLGSAQ